MAKLIVHIAFFIYCQAAAPAAPRAAGVADGVLAAEIGTDYKTDELWEDGGLIATTKAEERMFISHTTD
ncbi:hypothetical protein LOAG_19142 [Loa loa]|uniref:Secreted protein n=1 Tax=Loa loa TaxID=7209 RepID=A0A1I7V960_LOALO|nr:hypothetical protein LOAG_19142 [Loa loa]EJD73436.1 hypothetical protein LOAG_19142 [Loa loa]